MGNCKTQKAHLNKYSVSFYQKDKKIILLRTYIKPVHRINRETNQVIIYSPTYMAE